MSKAIGEKQTLWVMATQGWFPRSCLTTLDSTAQWLGLGPVYRE